MTLDKHGISHSVNAEKDTEIYVPNAACLPPRSDADSRPALHPGRSGFRPGQGRCLRIPDARNGFVGGAHPALLPAAAVREQYAALR